MPRRLQLRVFSSARNICGSSPGSIITASPVRAAARSQQFSPNCPLGSGTTSSSDTDFGLPLRPCFPIGEELFHGDGGRGSVTNRRGDLSGELYAKIAGGEQAWDRRHHAVIGDQVPTRVMSRVALDEPRIWLETDADEAHRRDA